MKVSITKGTAVGTVTAPPSKSLAHRMLICAGLSDGESRISGISYSQDILATLDCLAAIGASYKTEGDTVIIKGTVPGENTRPKEELRCRESGSTLRFFVPICLLSGENTLMTGAESLFSRPLGVYREMCEKRGLLFSQDLHSVMLRGKLKSGQYSISGNISSQFISGLLFALPLTDGDSTINIVPPIESKSYIMLTVSALAQFGVCVSFENEKTLCISGSQSYRAHNTSVEGDYSNAAALDALGCLGGNVKVIGLNKNSLQGDRVYSKCFDRLLRGTPTIHLADCPDLAPILFAVAAANNGGIFTGTHRLRMKESDRGAAMAQELKKFGTSVCIYDNEIVVYPADFHAPTELLCGHNDHRIVMALSVLLAITGGTITGAEAVNKSFPDFFEKLRELGIGVEISD